VRHTLSEYGISDLKIDLQACLCDGPLNPQFEVGDGRFTWFYFRDPFASTGNEDLFSASVFEGCQGFVCATMTHVGYTDTQRNGFIVVDAAVTIATLMIEDLYRVAETWAV